MSYLLVKNFNTDDRGGKSIESAADEILSRAKKEEKKLAFLFNEITVNVDPDSNRESLLVAYYKSLHKQDIQRIRKEHIKEKEAIFEELDKIMININETFFKLKNSFK